MDRSGSSCARPTRPTSARRGGGVRGGEPLPDQPSRRRHRHGRRPARHRLGAQRGPRVGCGRRYLHREGRPVAVESRRRVVPGIKIESKAALPSSRRSCRRGGRVRGGGLRRCGGAGRRPCSIQVVYCLNMFGAAVRDLLDPRLRGGGGRLDADSRCVGIEQPADRAAERRAAAALCVNETVGGGGAHSSQCSKVPSRVLV